MRRALVWVAVAACLALYWPGLTAWFQRDDFAWLGLGWQVRHGMPLSQALFTPMTEGTVRVLSERLYFVLLYSLFGLHALPYRLIVFATQAANLFLLAAVARRLTGSRAAGIGAVVLWGVNTALAAPLSWSSAYNQVLCAFFVLASLWLLLRYLETGSRGYYIAQWVTFILGFGASEFMIVYPAAALLLVLVRYRRVPRSVLALFLPSVVFVAYHFLVLKPPAAGPYALELDARIFSTFATYWRWSLGPGQLEWSEAMGAPVAGWLSLALTIPLIAFVAIEARRREFLPLALLAWYPLWLAPVIALPNHIIEYYPALGCIGLAMLASWAVTQSWRSRKVYAALAICCLVVYLATSIMSDRIATRWHHDQSLRAKALVQGVARAQAKYPGRTILVSGIDEQLFWAGVFDNPFRLLGGGAVYLAPGTPDWVRRRPELGNVAYKYRLPDPEDAAATVLYDVAANEIVPAGSLRIEKGGPAQTLIVANESSTPRLGNGWYQPEGTHRWMSKTASLTLDRPRTPERKLRIQGYAPAFLLRGGPVRLKVSAGDRSLGTSEIRQPDAAFAVEFPLPASLVGEGTMRVTLEVGRVVRPPADSRDLGLAITEVSVR